MKKKIQKKNKCIVVQTVQGYQCRMKRQKFLGVYKFLQIWFASGTKRYVKS